MFDIEAVNAIEQHDVREMASADIGRNHRSRRQIGHMHHRCGRGEVVVADDAGKVELVAGAEVCDVIETGRGAVGVDDVRFDPGERIVAEREAVLELASGESVVAGPPRDSVVSAVAIDVVVACPPATKSLPPPANMPSLPAPPEIVSLPTSALMKSLPLPPMSESLPAPPSRLLPPLPPTTVSCRRRRLACHGRYRR